jgi:ketosteroid isomerase-like protein
MVEVSGSGTLAQTIGPVFNPDGRLVARFYSTWRREEDGAWRIVFDNGYDVCRDSVP